MHIAFMLKDCFLVLCRYVLGRDVPVPSPAFSSQSKSAPAQVWQGQVLSVEDIEENIWSPRLGVKGKVDLTVKVSLRKKQVIFTTFMCLPNITENILSHLEMH